MHVHAQEAQAMEAAGDGHKSAASTVKKNRKSSKLRPARVASSDVPKVRDSANCEKRETERERYGERERKRARERERG